MCASGDDYDDVMELIGQQRVNVSGHQMVPPVAELRLQSEVEPAEVRYHGGGERARARTADTAASRIGSAPENRRSRPPYGCSCISESETRGTDEGCTRDHRARKKS